eukprot:jgi/Ulvmu1/6578/UM003_0215.1
MEVDRLVAMPVHLRFAAVKQQLNTSGDRQKLFDDSTKLLRCNDEVVVSAALEVLRTVISMKEVNLQVFRLLIGVVRVAQDNTAQILLSSIADMFVSASEATLAELDPGDPFLTIIDTAPHLELFVCECVQNMLTRLASMSEPSVRTEAFISHLQPLTLRCLSGSDGLSKSTAAALARLGSLCSPCLEAAASGLVLSLEVASEVNATTDIPVHLLDLIQHPDWPKTSEILKARAMLAMLSVLPKHSTPGSHHRLTLAAGTLAAAPKAPMRPGPLSSAVIKLVPAAVAASATAAEAPILQLLNVILRALSRTEANTRPAPALLACLKPALIHHLSLPAPSAIQDLSQSILSLLPEHPSQPAGVQIPQHRSTMEAHLADLMHIHTSTTNPSATIRFLQSIVRHASSSIPPGPRQERFESIIAALATPSPWPQPPGCCPSNSAPPSYARHVSPGTPPPPFAPSPLLVAHVATLIRHPDLPCYLAAAEALTACAFAAPSSVIPLFPYLLATAQSTLSSNPVPTPSGTDAATTTHNPVTLILPFLLLAVTAQSRYLDGPFFGVCAQLLADTNGPTLHALGLRMLLTFWLATGRGYQRLRAALLAFETPSPEALAAGRGGAARAAAPLRRAVAAAAVAVARESPDKAADVVSVMHGALRDEDDAAAAAGLEAIGAMCHQDALDLYGAWRVIVEIHPKLPTAPQTREQWLLVLAHGALDGREHPEQLQTTLALLWGALRQADARVRAAAAAAIAQYPLDLLEELEASRPLCELCEPRSKGAALEHLLCFSALATRALTHEHAHRRALVATSAPQATVSQRAALQTRLTRTLPPKLLERHGGSAAVRLELCALGEDRESQRSMQLLHEALEAMQWSAVPEISSAAGLEAVQAALGGFVNWALDAGGTTDTRLHAAIMEQLRSPSSTTARNAPIALAALFSATPLPPGSPSACIATLTATVATAASPPAVAAGAASGAAAILAAQPDADAASMHAVVTAVLTRITADVHADPEAAAAELVALGDLAAGYGLRHRELHEHARELVQRVFTLTMYILSECMPAMHDHTAVVVAKLPEGWSAAVDAQLQAVVDAVSRAEADEVAPCEAAATRVLLRLLEASEPAEADLLAVLVVALLQVARAEDRATPRGAEIAVLTGMPRLLRVLREKDLEGHITLVQQADLSAAPWGTPRDGCHLAAAARARGAAVSFSLRAALDSSAYAQHAAQHAAQGTSKDAPGVGEAVAAAAAAVKREAAHATGFADELAVALQRGKKLQRSPLVAGGVAHACAELVAVALAAPESFAAAAAGVGKAALKVLEGLVFGGSAGGGVPSALLAACCKEAHASASQGSAATSTLKPIASFPADGAMATTAPLILQDTGPADSSPSQRDRNIAVAAAALARAPWVAQADWEAAMQRHMHDAHVCASASELVLRASARVELMNVVIGHGHHRGAGFATWLASAARSSAAWMALPLYVRMHAFLWLPRLLDMLPPPAQDCLLLRAEEAATAAAGTSTKDDAASGEAQRTVPLVGSVPLCAVCAGVAACMQSLFRHTSAGTARPERERLQEKVRLLLQKLLGVVGVPSEWAQGSVQMLPEPADLPWQLSVAALTQDPAHSDAASKLTRECDEGAVVLLRRACMHNAAADDAADEAAAAALAVWASGRPIHMLPHAPTAANLQRWSWACLANAYSAMPAKTLHEVLVAPAVGRGSGDVCSPCMRWLAFGVVSAALPVHRPAATQLLHDIAGVAPVATDGELPGVWVAAADACARAVAADPAGLLSVAEAVTELLNSTEEATENVPHGSGEAGRKAAQGTASGGGAGAKDPSSRRVRWKLTVVAMVAWHVHHVHQDESVVVEFADCLASPAAADGDLLAWETPLRLLGTTIPAVVGVNGSKPSPGRDKVVQSLFEAWRELEVAGDSCAGLLLRPLQSLWHWLIQRDQALLLPYLAALE